jgi:hypothetical protein
MKKHILSTMLSVLALIATLTTTSCSDDTASATETSLKKLTAHDWDLSRVTVNGVDKTLLYSAVALQWNKDKTFSVTNGGAIWPSTGTFSFTDGSGKMLLVLLNNGENTEVTIQTLTDTQLIISLHWSETTIGQGRSKSVAGDHIFEFTAVH